MFGDMMSKLQQMKQETEEVKKRLENITVKGESPDGKVEVIINGNRVIKEIHIDDGLMEDKEELTDLLIIATNRGLENAEKLNESEMQGVAKNFMPNMPGQ